MTIFLGHLFPTCNIKYINKWKHNNNFAIALWPKMAPILKLVSLHESVKNYTVQFHRTIYLNKRSNFQLQEHLQI